MRAYERLLNYVKIHTTSDENSGTHPSFGGEWDLARLLQQELQDLGCTHVVLDGRCYLYGCLEATAGLEQAIPFGFIAHMDTSPEASGEAVKPELHPDYDGGDLVLGSGAVMSVKRFPFLRAMKGQTLMTTDGTTLLGADDKAGVAEIMTLLEELQEQKISHGPLWVAFTPDEEIGEGADYFNLELFPAKYAFTVDGGDVSALEYENFNAAGAKLHFKGLSVHPGDAKDTMINAAEVAMEFNRLLPALERPEHTSGHQGFFHLTAMKGHTSEAELEYIIRDHDRESFEGRKARLLSAAAEINTRYGEGTVTVDMRDSYYNMLEKIEPHRHLIDHAHEAIRRAGLQPVDLPIRGGTDGARLSFMGLPCPNLGTGGFNYHGVFEGISLEKMDQAVAVLRALTEIYSHFQE